jgi:hypothetical protein
LWKNRLPIVITTLTAAVQTDSPSTRSAGSSDCYVHLNLIACFSDARKFPHLVNDISYVLKYYKERRK